MTFEVKYRNKQGATEFLRVDAASRSEVFAILKERGISAIQVTDVTGKAKPRKLAVSGAPMSGAFKGLLALVAVCVIGAVAFMCVSKDEPKPVTEKPKVEKKSIEVVMPEIVEKASDPTPEPEKPIRATKKGTPIPDRVQPDEKGILRYPNGQRWVDPNDLHIVKHPEPRKIFKHSSENQIAVLLQLDPTRMAPFLIGKRRPYGDRFIVDFNNSLADKIEINDDDSPEDRELKEAVIGAKKDLYEAMQRGEDIAKMMNDTQRELDLMASCYNDVKSEYQRLMRDESVSDDEVEVFVKAANTVLAERGINGFTMPNLARRQAQLAVRREAMARREALKEGNQ